ncbi:unnamed protein product [Colletotrichum noveboracense]|uniref:Nephrocystin 3-like N-terminal domain-containing protein n=1 Tax=Colletotrichum noveboracense TaxID=2664923 RepID=A0A9W4S5S9_9PEZI|nr:hypothetical protein K456DRAFT_53801 [Colletotrichum gloeosporioides 23]CAI0653755.1 unnamed protein product [Colletotrichum noveboracense]
MAESLAALGVASNIVQFVELGFNITKAVIETYRSTDINGLAERNVDLVAMTSSLKDRCTLLQDDAAAKADPITMALLKRCIKVANELLSELEGLKMSTSDRNRSLTKFVKSIKAYWRKSKIEDLAARVEDIKKEIFERLEPLLYDHRKSLSEAMRSLGEASAAWNKATEKRLDAIARDLERLVNAQVVEQSTEDLESFAKQLSRFVDETNHRGNIRSILKSLHFAQIKERQNEIPRAHRNTFEWIFDESSSVNFTSWFQHSGQGVFWVTGKPGSGKSTMMKLILGHKTTKMLAEKWAGPRPLILVSHFFWSVGNKIQKSQEGLLRTLLFQIMVQCPEIIPKVCSERYSSPFRALESWSIEELSQTFERIQHIQELPIRILLLVDGLDEYSGEPSELTEFLGAIANSLNIKVCCASRPWPGFLKAFGKSRWTLAIHKLTQHDILRYVEDNMSEDAVLQALQHTQKHELQTLVLAIADRAEGVFFWVFLVVKSLLRGLQNHDTINILHKRLTELPSDLLQFFQRMLDSIEEVYVDDAYLAFMALLSAKTSLPLRFFRHLSVIRDSVTPKTVKNKLPNSKIVTDMNTILDNGGFDEVFDREFDPERREVEKILAMCRDLVQAWWIEQNNVRIGFVHRTVFEFLLQSPSLQQFNLAVPIGHHILFPMACLRNMEERSTELERVDSFLRICHFLQELETDKLTFSPRLWNGLCDVRKKSFLSCAPKSYQLLGHAQARFLLKLDAPIQGSLKGVYFTDIIAAILRGSVHVDVADCPQVTNSDRIDTELLAGILNLYEATLANSGDEFDHIWTTFIHNLSGRSLEVPPPKNVFQACKIFVERGAPRYLTPELTNDDRTEEQPSEFSEQKDLDVIHRLRVCGTFESAEVDELRDLFPTEPLPQRASVGFGQLWGWLTISRRIRHDVWGQDSAKMPADKF